MIIQSTKLGRVLNKNLVKLLIWDEMGCGIGFLVFWILLILLIRWWKNDQTKDLLVEKLLNF